MLGGKHGTTMAQKKLGQRECMRKLISSLGRDKSKVCAAYAKAERDGLVDRDSNTTKKSPEQYADTLWRDGYKKRWF